MLKMLLKTCWSGQKNEYKRGWCDALSNALKETYTIHTEEGSFQVVQKETLIGLGYAIDDSQAESYLQPGSRFLRKKERRQKLKKIIEWSRKHTWKVLATWWCFIAIINILQRDISLIDYIIPVILLVLEYWCRDNIK